MTLCQDAFEREARFMARLMGIDEIPLVVVRRPRPGELQDMDRDPGAVMRGFVNALTTPVRVLAKPGRL